MNYIVLDLEWNQAAYKADEEWKIPFEIIEIGAVKLNENCEIVESFQRLIRPQVYPFLLRRTKELTGWTDEDLDKDGIYFEDAAKEFLKFCGKDYKFVVWGGSDLSQFERNLAYYKMQIPWKYPLKYLDAQKMYALQENEGKQRRPLEMVVEKYGIPQERPFHHAADDAYYTAKIFALLDREKYEGYYSVDYYAVPRNRFEEKTFTFPTYSKYVSRAFNMKEEAVAHHRVREFPCRICGRKVKRIINWFTDGRTYLAMGMCKEHGLMRARIRVKAAEGFQGYFAVRTVKDCLPEDEKRLREKKDNITKKRREKRKREKAKGDAE